MLRVFDLGQILKPQVAEILALGKILLVVKMSSRRFKILLLEVIAFMHILLPQQLLALLTWFGSLKLDNLEIVSCRVVSCPFCID